MVFLGSACTCASCCIIILLPSGDAARCCSCGSGITPISGCWKAANVAVSCGWYAVEWWSVLTEVLLFMSWYIVSTLVPMRRTYFPMHFLTEILLCIKIVMQSFSHKLSDVLNVSMFWPRASDRSWSVSFPPSTQVARSPRSLGLFTLMLCSIMCVLSKAVASPDWSSLDAYWILSSRGVSVGSGIVTASHSHSSGSSRFVLS